MSSPFFGGTDVGFLTNMFVLRWQQLWNFTWHVGHQLVLLPRTAYLDTGTNGWLVQPWNTSLCTCHGVPFVPSPSGKLFTITIQILDDIRWLFSDDSSISQNLYLNSQNLFANLICNLKKWMVRFAFFKPCDCATAFQDFHQGKNTWFPGEILESKISSRGQWLLHLNLLKTFRFLQNKTRDHFSCTNLAVVSVVGIQNNDGKRWYFLCTNGNASSFQLPYLWFTKGLRQEKRVYPKVCHFLLDLRCQWKMKRFSSPECSEEWFFKPSPPAKTKKKQTCYSHLQLDDLRQKAVTYWESIVKDTKIFRMASDHYTMFHVFQSQCFPWKVRFDLIRGIFQDLWLEIGQFPGNQSLTSTWYVEDSTFRS